MPYATGANRLSDLPCLPSLRGQRPDHRAAYAGSANESANARFRGMTHSANGRLYRLALTYRATEDGLLVADQLPAARVLVRGEGALHLLLAALAEADDAAIVDAASRYGPLGPTKRLAIDDQPTYLWALDGTVRSNVRNLGLLRAWIAHGGTTPVPGRVAPIAHVLAVIAEADDDWTIARLAELLSEASSPLTEADRATLGRRVDRIEHRIYAGIGRRAARINADHARGDSHVTVHVQPGARRRLRGSARNWRFIMERAAADGALSDVVPPGSLGRLATELRPYLSEGDLPLYPAESIAEWRRACRELAGWVAELASQRDDLQRRRPSLRATLLYRLQTIDAWPFPTDELLGTFPRALWSLWQPVTGERPQRRCSWPDCMQLLQPDAYASRRHCDHHRREGDRLGAARNRERRARERPQQSR